MNLGQLLNDKECNNTERIDETQSRVSRDPVGRHYVDQGEVSDGSSGDDVSIVNVLKSVLGKPRGNKTAKKAEKDMTNESMLTFADIISESFVRAQKTAENSPSTSPQKPPQVLGVTGLTLSSGLEVLHVPRSGTQQMNAGILSKHNRGDTEAARLERRHAVTVALTNKLACNNMLSLVSSDDVGKHNLVADCQQ